jgi:hypothetical protein
MSEGINGHELAKESGETFDAWERWRKVKEHVQSTVPEPIRGMPTALETQPDVDRAIIEESVREQIRGSYKLYLEGSLPKGHPLLTVASERGFDPKATMEEAVRQLNSANRQLEVIKKAGDDSSDDILVFADTARTHFTKLFEWARGSEAMFQNQFRQKMIEYTGTDGWSISKVGNNYILNFESLDPEIIKGALQAIDASKDEILKFFYNQAGAEDVVKANEGMSSSLMQSLNRLADDIGKLRQKRDMEVSRVEDHLERDLTPAAKSDRKVQEIMEEYKGMAGRLKVVGDLLSNVVGKVKNPAAKESLLKMTEDERLLALVRRMSNAEGMVSGVESEKEKIETAFRGMLTGLHATVQGLYKAHDGSDLDIGHMIRNGEYAKFVDSCIDLLRKLEDPLRKSGEEAGSLREENTGLNAELTIMKAQLETLRESSEASERQNLQEEVSKLKYELEREMGEAGRARRALADYNYELKNIFTSLDVFEMLPRLDRAVYQTAHVALISDKAHSSDMSRGSTFESESEDFMEWLIDFDTIINCYLDDIQMITRRKADELGMSAGDVGALLRNPEHGKTLQREVMNTEEYKTWLKNTTYLRDRLSVALGQRFRHLTDARTYIKRLGNSCAKELEYIRDHFDADFGYKQLTNHLIGDRNLYEADDIKTMSGKHRMHKTENGSSPAS